MYSISYINKDKHRTDKHEGGQGGIVRIGRGVARSSGQEGMHVSDSLMVIALGKKGLCVCSPPLCQITYLICMLAKQEKKERLMTRGGLLSLLMGAHPLLSVCLLYGGRHMFGRADGDCSAHPPAQCVSPLFGEAHVWTC
jgi:hypothetical protein